MSKCEVCEDAAFLNVEAVNFGGKDYYLKPHSFVFKAVYCPKCGRKLPQSEPIKIGGTDV